jgi:hypothetical protein
MIDDLFDELADQVSPTGHACKDDDIGLWKRLLVAAAMLAAIGAVIWVVFRWV